MSACIRIKIMAGTEIEEAFKDCEETSFVLNGIAVETDFNGVEMFYHHQSLAEWKNEYRKRIFGLSHKGENDGR